jgi:hypothetical protein
MEIVSLKVANSGMLFKLEQNFPSSAKPRIIYLLYGVNNLRKCIRHSVFECLAGARKQPGPVLLQLTENLLKFIFEMAWKYVINVYQTLG